MPDPYISVIVTAHDRRQYLPEALHSLEQQTLDKSRFEVIVVKNFEDLRSDEIIKRNGWKDVVVPGRTSATQKIAIGLEEAKGEVITFLEDDDMYAPERLSTVHDRFSDNKDLIYFHNDRMEIDEDGRLKPRSFRPAEGDCTCTTRDKDLLARGRNFDLFFNLSSMAIRRHVLEDPYAKELLGKVTGGSNDYAIVALVVSREGLVHLTARPLTYYRVWSGGRRAILELRSKGLQHLDEFLRGYVRGLAESKRDFSILMEAVRGTPVEEAYTAKYLLSTFTLCSLREYGGFRASWNDYKLLLRYVLRWPSRALDLRPEPLTYSPLPRAVACLLPYAVRKLLIKWRAEQIVELKYLGA